jgi:L,D-peptidoglycan transpeptidase YkuD (ErfK/YbiS/YcfS/YnhG family)
MQFLIRQLITGRIGVAAAILLGGCTSAPLDLAHESWTKIQECERRCAVGGSHEALEAAEACYDSAWHIIARENRRWPFLRHYSPAERLLARAGKLADSSGQAADRRILDGRLELERRIERLREQLARLRGESNGHLKRVPLRRALTSAELKLANAASGLDVFSPGEVVTAIDKAEQALAIVKQLLEVEDSPGGQEASLWDYWLQQTIAWSATTDSAALVVIKEKHRAYLIKGGEIKHAFQADLGYNSGWRKLHAGDAATPEGIYQVVNKRDTGSSFYKSLDLNYPNSEDRRRFRLAQQAGRIPYGVGIGDGIGVHGDGGEGHDWTDGCVALTNPNMDRLMAEMNTGDRVTIVRRTDGWPE